MSHRVFPISLPRDAFSFEKTRSMWRWRGELSLLAAIVLQFLPSAPAIAAPGPMQTVRAIRTKIDRLANKKKSRQNDRKIIRELNRLLSFDEIGRRSLGRHWEKRKPAERTEFIGLLRRLIEQSFLKSIRGEGTGEIQYLKQEITGRRAVVQTGLKRRREVEGERIKISYLLMKMGARWKVVDMITDGLSLVGNYRAQFNKIIKKKSYRGLVGRMKRQLKRQRSSKS